jgi:hypothetical protein
MCLTKILRKQKQEALYLQLIEHPAEDDMVGTAGHHLIQGNIDGNNRLG